MPPLEKRPVLPDEDEEGVGPVGGPRRWRGVLLRQQPPPQRCQVAGNAIPRPLGSIGGLLGSLKTANQPLRRI